MARPKVFISYRRDDSAGHAGRLFDRLAERFGAEQVFRDVDTLAAGEDFQQAVRQRIEHCDVLLALIGKRWLAAADDRGQPRLAAADDLVRIEVASALQRGLRVIPVLLQGVDMPKAEELPADLAPLALRHAVDVRDASFDRDVEQLAELLAPGRHKTRPGPWVGLAVLGLLLLALGGWAWHQFAPSPENARVQLTQMGMAYDADTFVARASTGDQQAVTLFLRAGMAADAPDRHRVTALQGAVANGHMPIVQALLTRGADGASALPWAAGHARRDMVALLLARQPGAAALGQAMYNASGGPHTDIVKTLLDAGADVNTLGGRFQDSALTQAAAEPSAATVQLLLLHGADPSLRSEFGDTALLSATRTRGSSAGADEIAERLKVVRALLDSGAPLEDRLQSMQDWQPTPLLLAIESSLPELALLLIERGADVDAQTGFPGNFQPDLNALMWAAYKGQGAVVAALLDKGAQIDARNSAGHTALMIAADAGQTEVLQLLLRRGAKPTLRNRKGQTALALARQSGEAAAARLLAPVTTP